jgi:hypothetical protein
MVPTAGAHQRNKGEMEKSITVERTKDAQGT